MTTIDFNRFCLDAGHYCGVAYRDGYVIVKFDDSAGVIVRRFPDDDADGGDGEVFVEDGPLRWFERRESLVPA